MPSLSQRHSESRKDTDGCRFPTGRVHSEKILPHTLDDFHYSSRILCDPTIDHEAQQFVPIPAEKLRYYQIPELLEICYDDINRLLKYPVKRHLVKTQNMNRFDLMEQTQKSITQCLHAVFSRMENFMKVVVAAKPDTCASTIVSERDFWKRELDIVRKELCLSERKYEAQSVLHAKWRKLVHAEQHTQRLKYMQVWSKLLEKVHPKEMQRMQREVTYFDEVTLLDDEVQRQVKSRDEELQLLFETERQIHSRNMLEVHKEVKALRNQLEDQEEKEHALKRQMLMHQHEQQQLAAQNAVLVQKMATFELNVEKGESERDDNSTEKSSRTHTVGEVDCEQMKNSSSNRLFVLRKFVALRSLCDKQAELLHQSIEQTPCATKEEERRRSIVVHILQDMSSRIEQVQDEVGAGQKEELSEDLSCALTNKATLAETNRELLEIRMDASERTLRNLRIEFAQQKSDADLLKSANEILQEQRTKMQLEHNDLFDEIAVTQTKNLELKTALAELRAEMTDQDKSVEEALLKVRSAEDHIEKLETLRKEEERKHAETRELLLAEEEKVLAEQEKVREYEEKLAFSSVQTKLMLDESGSTDNKVEGLVQDHQREVRELHELLLKVEEQVTLEQGGALTEVAGIVRKWQSTVNGGETDLGGRYTRRIETQEDATTQTDGPMHSVDGACGAWPIVQTWPLPRARAQSRGNTLEDAYTEHERAMSSTRTALFRECDRIRFMVYNGQSFADPRYTQSEGVASAFIGAFSKLRDIHATSVQEVRLAIDHAQKQTTDDCASLNFALDSSCCELRHLKSLYAKMETRSLSLWEHVQMWITKVQRLLKSLDVKEFEIPPWLLRPFSVAAEQVPALRRVQKAQAGRADEMAAKLRARAQPVALELLPIRRYVASASNAPSASVCSTLLAQVAARKRDAPSAEPDENVMRMLQMRPAEVRGWLTVDALVQLLGGEDVADPSESSASGHSDSEREIDFVVETVRSRWLMQSGNAVRSTAPDDPMLEYFRKQWIEEENALAQEEFEKVGIVDVKEFGRPMAVNGVQPLDLPPPALSQPVAKCEPLAPLQFPNIPHPSGIVDDVECVYTDEADAEAYFAKVASEYGRGLGGRNAAFLQAGVIFSGRRPQGDAAAAKVKLRQQPRPKAKKSLCPEAPELALSLPPYAADEPPLAEGPDVAQSPVAPAAQEKRDPSPPSASPAPSSASDALVPKRRVAVSNCGTQVCAPRAVQKTQCVQTEEQEVVRYEETRRTAQRRKNEKKVARAAHQAPVSAIDAAEEGVGVERAGVQSPNRTQKPANQPLSGRLAEAGVPQSFSAENQPAPQSPSEPKSAVAPTPGRMAPAGVAQSPDSEAGAAYQAPSVRKPAYPPTLGRPKEADVAQPPIAASEPAPQSHSARKLAESPDSASELFPRAPSAQELALAPASSRPGAADVAESPDADARLVEGTGAQQSCNRVRFTDESINGSEDITPTAGPVVDERTFLTEQEDSIARQATGEAGQYFAERIAGEVDDYVAQYADDFVEVVDAMCGTDGVWEHAPEIIIDWLKLNLMQNQQALLYCSDWSVTALELWPSLTRQRLTRVLKEFEDFLLCIMCLQRPSKYEQRKGIRKVHRGRARPKPVRVDLAGPESEGEWAGWSDRAQGGKQGGNVRKGLALREIEREKEQNLCVENSSSWYLQYDLGKIFGFAIPAMIGDIQQDVYCMRYAEKLAPFRPLDRLLDAALLADRAQTQVMRDSEESTDKESDAEASPRACFWDMSAVAAVRSPARPVSPLPAHPSPQRLRRIHSSPRIDRGPESEPEGYTQTEALETQRLGTNRKKLARMAQLLERPTVDRVATLEEIRQFPTKFLRDKDAAEEARLLRRLRDISRCPDVRCGMDQGDRIGVAKALERLVPDDERTYFFSMMCSVFNGSKPKALLNLAFQRLKPADVVLPPQRTEQDEEDEAPMVIGTPVRDPSKAIAKPHRNWQKKNIRRQGKLLPVAILREDSNVGAVGWSYSANEICTSEIDSVPSIHSDFGRTELQAWRQAGWKPVENKDAQAMLPDVEDPQPPSSPLSLPPLSSAR